MQSKPKQDHSQSVLQNCLTLMISHCESRLNHVTEKKSNSITMGYEAKHKNGREKQKTLLILFFELNFDFEQNPPGAEKTIWGEHGRI